MARPFWKGTLGFGLVEIGVTLRPAKDADDLSFTLLDQGDFAPVGYKRYNKRTGKEVPWDHVVRGYEYEKDQYVVLSEDELRQAKSGTSQTIELLEFVERDAIDPIYFETPYFVEPQRRSSRSYLLMRTTLEQTGLVGIARVTLRTRPHVAALLVHDGVMMLDILRYAEQLRKPDDLQEPAANAEPESSTGRRSTTRGRKGAAAKTAVASRKVTAPSPAELRMATMLVQEMKGKWQPERYHDDYREDVLALVEKKVRAGKTHEIVTARSTAAPEPRQVMDLMPLLKRSLERRLGRSEPRAARTRPARETAKRRRHA